MRLLPLTPLAHISQSNKHHTLATIRVHILDLSRAHILDPSRALTPLVQLQTLAKTTMEVSSHLLGAQCIPLNREPTLQGKRLDPLHLQVNTLRIGPKRRGLCKTAWRHSAAAWLATVPAK